MNAPSPRSPSLVRLLLLAVWFGLLGGLLEIVMVQLALGAGVPVRLSVDYVWMTPASDILFAVTGLGLALAVSRWRRSPRDSAVLGVLTALLVLSLVFHVESLHRGAVLLLAAGVGSQAARLTRVRRLRRLFVLVLPMALAMAALVAYLGTSLRRGLTLRERTAIAALPEPPPGALSVLLLILDTVREAGTAPDTPALNAFSSRGVAFDRAIAPAPWTLPSHASFFTGQSPHQLSAGWSAPLDAHYPTLAEYLAGKGYLTAGFVGNLQFATRASGLDRGFVHYDDYQVNLGQMLLSSSIGRALAGATWLRRIVGYHELLNRRSAADVSDAFLAWQERQQNRPFFAFLNFFEAHEPYFPPGRSGSMLWPGPRWTRYEHVVGLSSGANAWIAEKWALSPAETAIHASGYHRAVSLADAQLHRVLTELDRRGVLKHTLVIIAGDHGEQLGEHHLFEHINSLYLPALHVPLVLVAPNIPEGVRIPESVGLRDLPATVADLLGFSAGAPFPGRSLAAHWTQQGAPSDTVLSALQRGLVRREWYPVGRGNAMFSLVTRQHHYIRNGDGSEELYDLEQDPAEAKNLAREAASGGILLTLRGALARAVGITLPSPTYSPP